MRALIAAQSWIVALSVVLTRPAAAGLSARLVYLRSGSAESCPNQGELKKAVARRLGYDPFLLAASHTIVAELSGNGTELRARAQLLDDSGIVLGSRELLGKGTDCVELLASLALAISVTLDPMTITTDVAADSQPSASTLTTVNPSADTASNDAAPQSPSVVNPSERKSKTAPVVVAPHQNKSNLSLALQASALATFGWVPALSPGAAVGLMLKHGPLSLGLTGATVAPRTKSTSNGLRATVSESHVLLAPCYWLGALGMCAIGTLGRYAAQGAGVDAPRSGSHLHAGVGARAVLSLPLSSYWSLGVSADALAVLTRPEFMVAGREVFRPGSWAANLGIFAEVQLF